MPNPCSFHESSFITAAFLQQHKLDPRVCDCCKDFTQTKKKPKTGPVICKHTSLINENCVIFAADHTLVRCDEYLRAAQLQTLDESVPPLGKAVQPCLEFTGDFFVLHTRQQVLAHGAQLVHGGPLRIQVCLYHLEPHQIPTQ